MNNERFELEDAVDVIDEILREGGEFRIYPRGSSMTPLIVEGRDSVILRRDKDHPVKKRDIAFYKRDDGHFVLHRVIRKEADGTYTMCGDHQLTLEKGIRDDQIIGYVSAIYRGEKCYKTSSILYKLFVFFWSCMPLRRVLLGIRRKFAFMKKQKKQ